jgi:hypothetical protein
MCGAIPPLINMPSWHGAQFKISIGSTLHLPLALVTKGPQFILQINDNGAKST